MNGMTGVGALTALVLAAGGVGAWTQHVTTPRRPLLEADEAARSNHRAGFERRAATLAGAGSVETTIDILGERIPIAGLVAEIGVETGMFEGVGEVRRSGGIVMAPLRFRDPLLHTTLVLNVRLERREHGWTITRVEDLGRYLAELDRLRQTKLAEVNAEAEARLRDHLKIGPVRVEVQSGGWLKEALDLAVTIRNTGRDPISLAHLVVRRPPDWREGLGRFPDLSFSFGGTLATGDSARLTHRMTINPFRSGHTALRGMTTLTADPALVMAWQNGRVRPITPYGSWASYAASVREDAI